MGDDEPSREHAREVGSYVLEARGVRAVGPRFAFAFAIERGNAQQARPAIDSPVVNQHYANLAYAVLAGAKTRGLDVDEGKRGHVNATGPIPRQKPPDDRVYAWSRTISAWTGVQYQLRIRPCLWVIRR